MYQAIRALHGKTFRAKGGKITIEVADHRGPNDRPALTIRIGAKEHAPTAVLSAASTLANLDPAELPIESDLDGGIAAAALASGLFADTGRCEDGKAIWRVGGGS